MADEKSYPIVLAHGIFRPDYLINSLTLKFKLSSSKFDPISDKFHYFRGISSHLKQHGFSVFHTTVSFAAEVSTRAQELTEEIEKILDHSGADKVHIIAHSMGGLDARYMIVKENMADKVASLTTIGTPHLGNAFADWCMEHGMTQVLRRLEKVINLKGVVSVTTAACEEFNESARHLEATNDVVYQVYSSSQIRKLTFLPFQVPWTIIHERQGANDGLVSVRSQQWVEEIVGNRGVTKKVRRHRFPIPADHLDQIGWWHLTFFQRSKWWKMSTFKERKQFEATIKNIYLEIARDIYNHKDTEGTKP